MHFVHEKRSDDETAGSCDKLCLICAKKYAYFSKLRFLQLPALRVSAMEILQRQEQDTRVSKTIKVAC